MNVSSRAQLWSFLLVAALVGCREGIAGPQDDSPLDLSPRVVGQWAGSYDGRLGLLGADSVITGTFRVVFDARRIGLDFAYDGRVLREAPDPRDLYGCSPAPLAVTNDRRVWFDCVQGTQFGDTPILRVEAQADTAFRTIRGVVRDGLGFEGAAYEITLTRQDL